MSKEKVSRFDRRKQETKAKIFKVAVELFLSQGYEQTTVEQITVKADVAKGTFFNHFPTKEAVLCYLGEQRMEILGEKLNRKVSNMQTSRDKIFCIFQILSEENEQNKELTGLIAREMFNRQSINMVQEKENQRMLRNLLSAILAEGQRLGEFQADFSPVKAADIFASAYFYTLFQWLENETEDSLGEELNNRVEIIFNGVATR